MKRKWKKNKRSVEQQTTRKKTNLKAKVKVEATGQEMRYTGTGY